MAATTAFDSEAFSLITPPNFGSGGGSCLPLMVVVALGDPGTPVNFLRHGRKRDCKRNEHH